MKKNITYSVFLALLIALVYGTAGAQTPEQQFQKGIMKEEGEGSLREAIELYKSVADNTNADRALRAKALYQMGNCYEKLGQQEARNVYEKLVANYTDPQELVANAKRKLSKLNVDQTNSENSGILIRQVPNHELDINAYSPDGRYATYNDWDDPEIGVIELKTGKKWFITKDGDWNSVKSHWPESGIWSPDSKQIVYDWNIEDMEQGESTYNCELRIVNKDGTNEHTLIKNGNKNLTGMDWSPDGSSILCTESFHKSDSCLLVLISVKDGSKKIITDIGSVRNTHATFTGDGKYIVFRARSKSNYKNYDIFIVSKDGGGVIPLITNKEDDGAPFRISGTNQFVYFSSHSGTKDLWSMTIENGKVLGNPGILKSDFDKTYFINGATTDGSLICSSTSLNSDIYKAILDFATHEAQITSLNIQRNSSRKIVRAIWSPSFKKVIGLIDTFSPEGRLAPLKFVTQDIQSGKEIEISTDLGTYPIFWWIEPQWTKDEKSILIKGESKDGVKGIFQVDVQTGKVIPYQTPMKYTAWEWRYLQFSPDGEFQYFISQNEITSKQKLIARNIKSGEEKTIKEFDKWVDKILLSPDGRTIAVQMQKTLLTLPADGTGEMKKLEAFEGVGGIPVGWSSDGNTIYAARADSKKGLGIWSISLDNEPALELFKPEQLKEFKGAEGLKISNVGDDIYLTMQNGARITEYWAIENIIQK